MVFRSLAVAAALFSNTTLSQQLDHHVISPLTHALRIGADFNGHPFYLCQARLYNRLLPGKTSVDFNFCSIPYNGKEYRVKQFDIPTQHAFGHINWGTHLDKAVIMGRNAEDKPLFLCQSAFNGSIQPGITWPGISHCAMVINGREVISNHYRVLTSRARININADTIVPKHYHKELRHNKPLR